MPWLAKGQNLPRGEWKELGTARKACTYFQRHGAQSHLPSLLLSTSLPSAFRPFLSALQGMFKGTPSRPAQCLPEASGSPLSSWEG